LQEETCNFNNSSKLEIIKRLQSRESRLNVMASQNNSSSNIYDIKKQKNQLKTFWHQVKV
jgi:hypothetical protein